MNTSPRAIHHLNCGTMCPRGARMIAGEGGLLGERAARLPLPARSRAPRGSCSSTPASASTTRATRASSGCRSPRSCARALNAAETAIAQIRELGFEPNDVRHIITTHLDLDHAGGLPDFPDAEVHLLGRELEAAMNPSWRERPRYVAAHWAHGPRWVKHDAGGDEWFGFDSLRILPGSDAEIVLIPLTGHTLGHTGVAIKQARRLAAALRRRLLPPRRGADAAALPAGARAPSRRSTRSTAPRAGRTATACASSPSATDEEVELICSHDASYLVGR